MMVEGSTRKLDSSVESIAQRSSEIDPSLEQPEKLKGLSAPNFYVVDIPIANPGGALKPGMVGIARIYGPRRSLVGLMWASIRRGVVRKFW